MPTSASWRRSAHSVRVTWFLSNHQCYLCEQRECDLAVLKNTATQDILRIENEAIKEQPSLGVESETVGTLGERETEG